MSEIEQLKKRIKAKQAAKNTMFSALADAIQYGRGAYMVNMDKLEFPTDGQLRDDITVQQIKTNIMNHWKRKAEEMDQANNETILDGLRKMKVMALEQGIKPPFTVKMSAQTFDRLTGDLRRELGNGTLIEYKMIKGERIYQIEGMNIEVEWFGRNTPPYLISEG